MKELICIICPKGCHLKVDENNGFSVSGNACERGATYGKKELQNPTRTLTSTVKIEGAGHGYLPVKSDGEIPKELMLKAVRALDAVLVQAPIKCGDVVLCDVVGTGIDIVATRTMQAECLKG